MAAPHLAGAQCGLQSRPHVALRQSSFRAAYSKFRCLAARPVARKRQTQPVALLTDRAVYISVCGTSPRVATMLRKVSLDDNDGQGTIGDASVRCDKFIACARILRVSRVWAPSGCSRVGFLASDLPQSFKPQ
jgi:hypothetical protein